jgi:hypothetical protein
VDVVGDSKHCQEKVEQIRKNMLFARKCFVLSPTGEKLEAACCPHNPVSNLKCGTTMVLESSTTFLCIVTVSFAWCQVENPLATNQNCQAINTKSGLLSERKWQYDKS